jgi:adenylosuccinate lyase
MEELAAFSFKGKFNGAVGGYQAMISAYPEIDWLKLSRELVEGLGFDWRDLTTQIAPADDLVKLCSIYQRLNLILVDLNQDVWRYISDGWLLKKVKRIFGVQPCLKKLIQLSLKL